MSTLARIEDMMVPEREIAQGELVSGGLRIYDEMIGQVVDKINGGTVRSSLLEFCVGDSAFYFFHDPVCCELVEIKDIAGDLNDLIGSPILMAEMVSSRKETSEYGGECEWTFYKFGTRKGTVTIRWCGQSNGNYLHIWKAGVGGRIDRKA
jgi:hypothetical protein